MKNLLFVLLMSSSMITMAQSKFKAGYIIKNDGDSISGLISSEKGNKKRTVCIFRDNSEKTVKYSPKELRLFKFYDGKLYISKELSIDNKTENVFLEYLVKGKIDLFFYKDKQGNHYYIETENDDLLELKNSKYVVTNANASYTKSKREYIGILKNTFIDCPEIQNELDKLEFNHKSLIATTKNYHELTCNEYDCITYDKNIKLKYSLGYTIGVSNSTIKFKSKDYRLSFIDEEDFKYSPSITTGVFVSISDIFGISENQSLNFQIAYKGCKYESENIKIEQQTIYVPIYFTYSFPTGKLKPTINYGFSNSILLNTSIDMVNETDKVNLEQTLGNYMISGLVGLGLEYAGEKITYMFYSNYEIGSGINKSEHKANYLSSLSKYLTINLGIKYKL